MAGHGACSKVACGCLAYSKSILTPGLCKTCNHVKDAHNQFIASDMDTLSDHDLYTSPHQLPNSTTTTSYDYDSSEENDLNAHPEKKGKRHKSKKKKSLLQSNKDNTTKPVTLYNENIAATDYVTDNYPQQLLKKKEKSDHTQTMWKIKYEQSQKEVERWQTKYNDLYVKYKALLAEKEANQGADSQSIAATQTQTQTQTQSHTPTQPQPAMSENTVDLLFGDPITHNHVHTEPNMPLNNGHHAHPANKNDNSFSQWYAFDD